MGWTNTAQDEIIAPNTVPFLPGNNVTGFGSQVPDELVAAGFPNAIVFYATDWVATNVTPTVKFRFIAANANGLTIGYGLVNNPSVSQTATVVLSETIQTPSGISGISFKNSAGVEIFLLGQISNNAYMSIKDGSGNIRNDIETTGSLVSWNLYDVNGIARAGMGADDSGNSSWTIYDPSGAARGQCVLSSTLVNLKIGIGTLFQTYSTGYIQTDTPFVEDTAWTALPLAGTWAADANNTPQYRMMPDDTVMVRGHITKAAGVVNGEAISTALPAAYRPLRFWNFFASSTAVTSGQKVSIETDGTMHVWFPPAGNGDIVLTGARWAADNV